jgi:hypothetical protein
MNAGLRALSVVAVRCGGVAEAANNHRNRFEDLDEATGLDDQLG